ATGELLILSQVILSLQLGFAIIPLIHLTSDKKHMGEFANKLWIKICAWVVAVIIIYYNAELVFDTLNEWISTSKNPGIYYFTLVPVVVAAAILLLYITFSPFLKKAGSKRKSVPDGLPEDLTITATKKYKRIAVTVDFSSSDSKAISNAFTQGGNIAEYILIHIVETAGARMMGQEIDDLETVSDKINLEKYKTELESKGFIVHTKLGFGNPKKSIPEIVNNCDCDLLVMGAHGHRGLKDLVFGTTLDAVRHNVKVPVLIVK
ncbi:MAG: universal stress protein, partial [Bacteroidia bacterium]